VTEEEQQPPTQPTEGKLDTKSWRETMPQEAIDDIESLFLSPTEVAQKEAIFNKVNKDYIDIRRNIVRQKSRPEPIKIKNWLSRHRGWNGIANPKTVERRRQKLQKKLYFRLLPAGKLVGKLITMPCLPFSKMVISPRWVLLVPMKRIHLKQKGWRNILKYEKEYCMGIYLQFIQIKYSKINSYFLVSIVPH
jgi:hypothetical protein